MFWVFLFNRILVVILLALWFRHFHFLIHSFSELCFVCYCQHWLFFQVQFKHVTPSGLKHMNDPKFAIFLGIIFPYKKGRVTVRVLKIQSTRFYLFSQIVFFGRNKKTCHYWQECGESEWYSHVLVGVWIQLFFFPFYSCTCDIRNFPG